MGENMFNINITDRIKNFVLKNPIFVVFVLIGLIIGNYLSFIVSWIPLIGGLFSFMFSLIGGVAGGYVYYKLKK